VTPYYIYARLYVMLWVRNLYVTGLLLHRRMPTQTVNFKDGHIQYILATKAVEQSFSDRVREIMDKGIEAEE